MNRVMIVAASLLALGAAVRGSRASDPAKTPAPPPGIRFNRDIRPILSENCFYCHGPDSAHRKAGLRLDQENGLFGSRDNGPAVVKGKPAESQLIKRINSTDPDEQMPPPDSRKSLTAQQKDLLKQWVDGGGGWEPHWSLVPPVAAALPDVGRNGWARNPIDRFVLAKLESAHLAPAAEADRRTLARRVSFDLTGLPPAAKDLENFLNDPAADAYERFVDRLLASPAYGEHRARYWLDAARYGDTHGIHNDNYREMWPYRDWVINAFNQNVPFDRFTIEQLAGDLLPNRTLEQQVASGFNRCNITTSEGGSIAEEVEVMYTKDRVETTSVVWLGLTTGCASCHDHKFDPVSQKEFYQLAAFFRNTTQRALDGNVSDTPPIVVVPREADRGRWESLQKEADALQALRAHRKTDDSAAFDAWAASPEGKALHDPVSPAEESLSIPFDEAKGTNVAARLNAEEATVKLASDVTLGDGHARGAHAAHFGPKASIDVLDAGDFEADQPFTVGAWVYVPKEEGSYVVASKLDPKSKGQPQGWVIELDNRVPSFRLLGKTAADRLQLRGNNSTRLAAGKWYQLCVTYDGSRTVDGMTLYVDGKAEHAEQAQDVALTGTIRNGGPLRIGSDGAKRDLRGGAVEDFRIYRRELLGDEVSVLSRWSALRQSLAKAAGKLSGPERQDLLLLYLTRFDSAYTTASRKLADVQDGQRQIRRHSPVTHVMQEKSDTPPMAYVLYRGNYDQRRDEVKPLTPAALHAWPQGAPRNRLGLAQWLTDRKNPLTARVTINRFWQEVFGDGLVRSAGDFGVMGENPSNPELLDWLAVDFQKDWDIKRVIRQIVTSATYRQSAAVTPEKLRADSSNRLLSRGPRFRMDAEMLRDFALSSSGLLVEKLGGPSVKPYQPPGVWEAVAMSSSNTRSYVQDTGEKLYRRSLYTFWKRSAAPAALEIFNAPTREVCTVRRERTDTPLQALVTMNDPQWVEAARRLAERALTEAPSDFDGRLDYITERALARPFEPRERAICRDTLAAFTAQYAADPAAAAKLIAIGDSKADPRLVAGDLAAWTMLVSQVMNTDEALNK